MQRRERGVGLSRRAFLTALGVGLPIAAAGAAGLVAADAPFTPPFGGAGGPGSWYIIQWYGNTRWAYRQQSALYSQGQGLHFGVDFGAACGTPVLAIGDGTVAAVDGPYGSPPHNVLVRHSNGYASLYGHLLQRATIAVGTQVARGQAIAISGAPSGTDCDTRPHLHLEIRTSGLGSTVNPVNLITANWEDLTLGLEGEGLAFEVDLDAPERWQTIRDQPNVTFGGRILNSYARPWPP